MVSSQEVALRSAEHRAPVAAVWLVAVLAVVAGACASPSVSEDLETPRADEVPAPAEAPEGADEEEDAEDAEGAEEGPAAAETDPAPADEAQERSEPRGPRPDWLGTRELPVRPDGLGEVQPTPPELVDRRFRPPDDQPSAPDDSFAASIEPVPAEVAARSTWRPECPVDLDDLRYLTVTFWGFDERTYLGELLVHASAAEDLVGVFEELHAERFPIEQMQIVSAEDLELPPTGDGNNTTAFVCRTTVQGANWSEHAYGLAVDINPFHNPYVRGEVVVPELASAYLDRDDQRPGMIRAGDVVTTAFAAIGWGWGGDWRSAIDWMHFSATGR